MKKRITITQEISVCDVCGVELGTYRQQYRDKELCMKKTCYLTAQTT